MSDPGASNQPLVNDPVREAVDTMRGYSFQILRSVLAWIELPENEVLYLEGAEDLDQVAGDAATTTQIKDTRGSGNVTLRSPGALKAIDNYWSHCSRNPGRRIRFRYLTTSAVGAERDDPFGHGLPGIDLWSRAKQGNNPERQTADLAALKAFLLVQNSLSEDLKAFLARCSEDELLHELIAPIDWDTAAGDAAAVLEAIRGRLVVLGAKRQVPAHDAEAVIGALHLEAWTVATRDRDRILDRAGFLRVFDYNTRISVPKAQYTALIARVAPAGATGAPLPAVVGDQRTIEPPPPLPPRYYEREALLAQVATAAAHNPVMILQGSTGMSKTTTAAAFASRHGGTWGWLNLRGHDAQSAQRRLAAALGEVTAGRAPLHLAIDDLDTGQDLRSCEGVIARLAAVQRDRGGLLLVCVAQDPPPRLMRVLQTRPDEILRMPRFEREEIDGFLLECGCADPGRRASWAGIIEVNTLGHPQLVHARVAVLEASGYRPPEPQDLLQTPGEVLDARAEARKLLAHLGSSPRELIYRLSLTTHALSHDQIIAIAGAPPALPEPGNSLDQLIGPWLEHIGAGVYRVSPLVLNAGEAVHGAEWAQAMHGGVAWALLHGNVLTPFDVSAILLHSLAARDEAAIARLAFGLMTASTEVWHAIGEAAFWLVYVGVDANLETPVQDKGTLFLFRLMQLRIAVATRSETLASIVTRTLDEFPAGDESMLARLGRHIFLGEVLLRPTQSLGLPQLLGLAHEFVRASDELGDVIAAAHPGEQDPKLTGPDGSKDFAIVAGLCILQRVENRADLVDLLAGLGAWNDSFVRRALWLAGQDEFLARHMLDRVWLAEFQTDTPSWAELLALYERLYGLARRCGLDGLARVAAKIIARMTDEELHAPTKALERASAFAGEIGDSPSLQDGRARILVHAGDDAAALELWRSALPNWRTDEADLAPSLSYRDAAVAAARLNRWGEAAELFSAGADRISPGEQAAFRAGMLIDSGFASWKAGDNARALSQLAAGLQELDRLRADADTDPVYTVQKRAGHTLMWVQATTSGRPPDKYSEPPPGCCSNLEPMEGERPPQTPMDFILGHLIQFEQAAGGGDEQLGMYVERLKTSPYTLVRLTTYELIVRSRLSRLDMSGYLKDVVALVRALALSKEIYVNGGGDGYSQIPADAVPTLAADHHNMMRTYAVIGLFALVARGAVDPAVIASWRREAADANVSEVFDAWLDLVDGLLVSGQVDASATVHRRDIDWTAQCLAALRLAIDPDTEPALLIQCHGLWLNYFGKLPNRDLIGPDVAELVAAGWKRCANRRFLLHTPRTSVPALHEAIAGPERGWGRVKRIVGAGLDAVRYDVGSAARDALSKFPE